MTAAQMQPGMPESTFAVAGVRLRKMRNALDPATGTVRMPAAAQRFETVKFRSGVFLSQMGGRDRYMPSLSVVQAAPIMGFAVGYSDGDARADLLTFRNDFAPFGSVGRCDGLRPSLRGCSENPAGFTAGPPDGNGVVISRAARVAARRSCGAGTPPMLLMTRNRVYPPALRRRAQL